MFFDFNQRIISATLDLVCCFKVNTAFYEARGPLGLDALMEDGAVYQRVRARPVMSMQRGRLAHSSKAHASTCMRSWGGTP